MCVMPWRLIKDVQVDGLPAAPTWLASVPLVGDRLVAIWNSIDQQGAALMLSIKPYLGQVGNWLLARSAQIGGGILELTLSMVFVFFFYRDGPRLAVFVHRLLERLIGERAGYYIELVAGTVQRVVNGVIGTAAAQAVLALIGFLIAGVPGALVLGIVTFLLSLIPMGPPLVWIPATAWLAWKGEYDLGGVPLCVGHLHHQRRGQRAQALPDQPGWQLAVGDRAAGCVWRLDRLRLYRSVYRPDAAGGGLQFVDRLECDPGAGAPRR